MTPDDLKRLAADGRMNPSDRFFVGSRHPLPRPIDRP